MQERGVRLAELMAAWSMAIDVGTAAPLETGLRVCRLATGLARAAGVDEDTCRRAYYLALVRRIGCTAGNRELAALVGDERAFRRGRGETVPSWWHPAARIRLRRGAPGIKEVARAGLEVGQLLVRRLGLGSGVEHDLPLVFEQYDGSGFPDRVPASEITMSAQCVHLADTVVAAVDAVGPTHAVDLVLDGRGRAFAPDLADLFLLEAASLEGDPDTVWEDVLGMEPGSAVVLDDSSLDVALRAFADFVDLTSPWTVGHSRDVASLAFDAASSLGLFSPESVRRAGWLHDAGRLSVSVRVWEKESPLTREEREAVRLHAYYTERVFARPSSLAQLGALAGLHHERTDGSGYHRGSSSFSVEASVLAAADVYAALVADRPHREGFVPLDAARALRWEVQEGRLSADAAEAVLKAVPTPPREVSGLTTREVEVLRLLALGRSATDIAAALVVSPRTVDQHVEAAFVKAGVRSQAAASVFAMQHGLVSALAEASP